MRFSFTTLFLSTLSLISLVSAAKPHFVSRHDHKRSPVPNVLVARQHRVTRDLIDVCINVKVDLLADASQLLGLGPLLGPIDLGAKIQLCLCLDVRYFFAESVHILTFFFFFLARTSTFISKPTTKSKASSICSEKMQ